MRLVLDGCMMEFYTCPSDLKIPIEALMGVSDVYSPEGLSSSLLSPGCVLEYSSHHGTVGRMVIPKTEEGKEPLSAWFMSSH